MPDWFEGSPADISWYPPDNKEKGEKLGSFFQTTAAPPKTVPRVPKVVQELSQKHPEIKEWGVVGYCWGGKVTLPFKYGGYVELDSSANQSVTPDCQPGLPARNSIQGSSFLPPGYGRP